MSHDLVVLKFGGDALASPPRIAAAARLVQARRREGPVVAVVSARRGVTDHLTALAREVLAATGAPRTGSPHAERAVAAGEVVTASLLALALEALDTPAVPLDAREAGLEGVAGPDGVTLGDLAPGRVRQWLARGAVPVVTGFQAWRHGRYHTLARGGSDLTAVALGVALRARRVEFLKLHPVRTADPRLDPAAPALTRVAHGWLVALAEGGTGPLQREAAARAAHACLPLRFTPLDGGPSTDVVTDGPDAPVLDALPALAACPGARGP